MIIIFSILLILWHKHQKGFCDFTIPKVTYEYLLHFMSSLKSLLNAIESKEYLKTKNIKMIVKG